MGFPLMERVVYDKMAELDDRHWWYRARRDVLAALIRRVVRPPAAASILEIGCGTGHNLAMLSQFGHVDALELDDEARAFAEKRVGRAIMRAPLPELAGVPEHHYDLIGALDVIEHIDDDHAAIAAIATRLKPGGKFVITVPAHPWMWSAHDVVSHHKRRYSKISLRRLIDGSPLRIDSIGYFNSLLFPLAVAQRLTFKMFNAQKPRLEIPSAPVNSALRHTFAAERHLIGRFPLPPGLSLFAVASRIRG
jgi:SAM-dependent methyltransferase